MDSWAVIQEHWEDGECTLRSTTFYGTEREAIRKSSEAEKHYLRQGYKQVSPGRLKKDGVVYNIRVKSEKLP